MYKRFLPVLIALFSTAVLAAQPVTLYRVDLTPGTNAYRYAGAHGWPVYYTQGNVALVGKAVSREGCPEVVSIAEVYTGPSQNLQWVHSQKGKSPAEFGGKALFRQPGIALVESGTSGQAGKNRGGFLFQNFSGDPVTLRPMAEIINPGLLKDTTAAVLAQSVSIAHFQATVETLQAFPNRNAEGTYDDSAAAWMISKFQSFGITDVRTDTFTFPHTQGIGTCHNVIATIPGTMDTGTCYVVGGHYDTSVWLGDTLGLRGPGADDNGSGTAAAVEMARVFAANPPRYTVRFIAFDCEEWGLYGGEKAASDAQAAGTNIGLMMNYDMIGNLGNDTLFHCYKYDGSEVYGGFSGQSALWYGRTADTNLIPFYVNDNSSGSDSWEYWNRGFPVAYSEEYEFSPNWHKFTDSTTYMNMRYATSIVRAGVGMLATLANYPQKVNGFDVTDVGSGTQLFTKWRPNPADNITGYKIYWGRNSGSYTDSLSLSDTSYTIGGLLADSLYHIAIMAVDDSAKGSPIITEVTGTPRTAPAAPAGLAAAPVDSGITLNWLKNRELDLAGYIVYHKIDNGGYDSLTYTTDTFLLDQPLSGASRYYYKVKARDGDGNKGPLSDSAYGRPITLDQGILIVDETNNWTSGNYPRDAQQDSFYNYILSDYKSAQLEYGTAQQMPVMSDFGPYSSLLWVGDDNSNFLASGAVNGMKSYLAAGGKMWIAGWKPTGDIRSSAAYPADMTAGSILYDYFQISHAALSGTADSFKTAKGLEGYPDIMVDTLKYPATVYGKTMRLIEALTPAGSGDSIYVMDMKNDGSPYEGRACAVRDSGKTVFFGFPLYFMNRDQARAAAHKVMLEFGEQPLGVSGKPDTKVAIRDTRLFQNAPNPFKQSTTINYQLSKPGLTTLKLYNIQGQLVRTLVNGVQNPGSYSVKWDGRDGNNLQVSNGVYVYRMDAAGDRGVKKMLLLR